MSSCHHVTMSSCHHVIMSSCQHVIISSGHHVTMSSCQHCHHVIISTCHHVNMSTCHHVIMSTCHGYPANSHQSYSHLVGICHNDNGWEYDTVTVPYTKMMSTITWIHYGIGLSEKANTAPESISLFCRMIT